MSREPRAANREGRRLFWRQGQHLFRDADGGRRRFQFARWLISTLGVLAATVPLPLPAADTNAVLNGWLAAQADLQTWSADCVQTRTLRTLTTPLVSTGRVWFATPDRFRWELGRPAQTVAVRRGEELWIAYPRLQRAERYALGGGAAGPWRDALALLEAGFPRSREQVERQFRLTALAATNDVWELRLQPRSSTARRFISEVRVAVSTNEGALRATELVFADGSRMRNDFERPVPNPSLEAKLFEPPLEPGYTVTEPLKP